MIHVDAGVAAKGRGAKLSEEIVNVKYEFKTRWANDEGMARNKGLQGLFMHRRITGPACFINFTCERAAYN